MFIRKKKVLELIDMHISSVEYVKKISRESHEAFGRSFEESFTNVYTDGMLAALDRLKREFTH